MHRADTSNHHHTWRLTQRDALGGLAIALAFLAVAGAALLSGSGGAEVTTTVESASASAGGLLESLATVLPLGWAFGAGMVAAVNPCGFAMLPAYLGLYLGLGAGEGTPAGTERRGLRGLRSALAVGLAMTAGFVLLFGVMGLLLSVTTATVSGALPWAGLTVGATLVVIGGLMLRGTMLITSFGERVADRLGRSRGQALGPMDRRSSGLWGYLVYGVAYGLASLSCTLPIFLAVIGGSLTTSGFLDSLTQFVLYGLGMGTVILVLTLALALFRSAALRHARSVVRFVQPVSAVLSLLAGAYVMYYWLTLGGLLERLS